jgi:hypothetical protein
MNKKAILGCALFLSALALNAQSRTAASEFVFVQGGTFTMGSPATEQNRYDNESSEHEVAVSDFYIGKYEVTFSHGSHMLPSHELQQSGLSLKIKPPQFSQT